MCVSKTQQIEEIDGICNLGNSCFSSAVFSCLSKIPPFVTTISQNHLWQILWDFFNRNLFYDEKTLEDYCTQFINEGALKDVDENDDNVEFCIMKSLTSTDESDDDYSHTFLYPYRSVIRLFNSQFNPILLLLITFRFLGVRRSLPYIDSSIYSNLPNPPPYDPKHVFNLLSQRSDLFFSPNQMVYISFICIYVLFFFLFYLLL
jgi:hypothetical protein